MRQILKQLNLSSKEIDVYLAALKLGSASFTELAKHAGIKRPTTYVILEKLKEMGIVSLSRKKGRQIFVAEDPEKLLKLLEEEKEILLKREEELKIALPKLKALTKKDTVVPLVKYYEGKEGVWNIIDDLMKSKQDAYIISTGRAYDILGFKRVIKDVINKRKQIGTTAYIISDHHPEQIKEYEKKETLFREYRFLPETINLNSIVYIYKNKVSLIFFKEPLSGITIENEELFSVFKFMFNSLWKELEGKNLPE